MNNKIYVVQYEHGGIPEEPQLFNNHTDAEITAEKMMVEQGMRPKKMDEYFEDYYSLYQETLNSSGEFDTDEIEVMMENTWPDPDDTVRMWECKIK